MKELVLKLWRRKKENRAICSQAAKQPFIRKGGKSMGAVASVQQQSFWLVTGNAGTDPSRLLGYCMCAYSTVFPPFLHHDSQSTDVTLAVWFTLFLGMWLGASRYFSSVQRLTIFFLKKVPLWLVLCLLLFCSSTVMTPCPRCLQPGTD